MINPGEEIYVSDKGTMFMKAPISVFGVFFFLSTVTDGRTYGRTEKPSYINARMCLISKEERKGREKEEELLGP